MTHLYRCVFELMEPVFFSSREIGNYYQTEPLFGNYALAYAFGLCVSPYRNPGQVAYKQDLGGLNQRGLYVTPGTIIGAPRFTIGEFNAQTDTYWYAMGNNLLVTRPDGMWAEGRSGSWYVMDRPGERGRKLNVENRPQNGRIRYLAIGNRATCYVFSAEPVALPRYIRLGKFMSKARVAVEELSIRPEQVNQQQTAILLNPVDLPPDVTLMPLDIVNVPPAALVRSGLITGMCYRIDRESYLPVGMRFGVDFL
ncbi:MAG: hypothetical protein OHK0022_49170 [Roseiflexaceae bacterium]